MAKIYISSTYSDLKDYRAAVYDILRKMRHDVIAMEDYVATDERPLDKCLADVANCDLYVGIVAWRYGYIPKKDIPEKRSITEREFREAAKHGKPSLLFLLSEDVPWLLSPHGKRTSSAGKPKELHQVGNAPPGPLAFDFQRAFARIPPQ